MAADVEAQKAKRDKFSRCDLPYFLNVAFSKEEKPSSGFNLDFLFFSIASASFAPRCLKK